MVTTCSQLGRDGGDDDDGVDDQATVNWGLYGDTPQLGGAWKHFA